MKAPCPCFHLLVQYPANTTSKYPRYASTRHAISRISACQLADIAQEKYSQPYLGMPEALPMATSSAPSAHLSSRMHADFGCILSHAAGKHAILRI